MVGPLPPSPKGRRYLLTMIDRFTRWIEAVPLRDIQAETVAYALYTTWLTRYGIPDFIVSDQGTQFESFLFKKTLAYFGIERKRSTAFHPQTNGLVERAHGTLKSMLRCLSSRLTNWEDALPSALFAMRTALNDLNISPSMVVFGESISLPSTFISKDENDVRDLTGTFMEQLNEDIKMLREYILKYDPTLANVPDHIPAHGDMTKYNYVFVKDHTSSTSLSPKYTGPFRIIEVRHPVLKIDKNGQIENVNVDNCKPVYRLADHNDE